MDNVSDVYNCQIVKCAVITVCILVCSPVLCTKHRVCTDDLSVVQFDIVGCAEMI